MSNKLYDLDKVAEDPVLDLRIPNDFIEALRHSLFGRILLEGNEDPKTLLDNVYFRSILAGWKLHETYNSKIQDVQESLDHISMNLYTCNTCLNKDCCEYAFNEFNFNGMCLLEEKGCIECDNVEDCPCKGKFNCDRSCVVNE